MQNSTQLTIIIFTILITTTIEADNNDTVCNKRCGKESVQYPFGFSQSCLIKLDCTESSGEIKVGGFKVQNITENGVVLEIGVTCDRSIDSLKPLFGQNYALSYQNSLLLQNCTKRQDACLIKTSTFLSSTKRESCSPKSDNISCLPLSNNGVKRVLTYESVNFTGCRNVFSSFVIGSGQPVSLEFERVQLDWWVNGNCDCAKNAKCENFSTVESGKGFRCQCTDGFIGDGFKHGRGCRSGESTLLNFDFLCFSLK